jgi:hypothetical protein
MWHTQSDRKALALRDRRRNSKSHAIFREPIHGSKVTSCKTHFCVTWTGGATRHMTKTIDEGSLHWITTGCLPMDGQDIKDVKDVKDVKEGQAIPFTECTDLGERGLTAGEQIPKGSWPEVLGGRIELPSLYGTPER